MLVETLGNFCRAEDADSAVSGFNTNLRTQPTSSDLFAFHGVLMHLTNQAQACPIPCSAWSGVVSVCSNTILTE